MILQLFTLFHVAISLVGIGSGFIVLYGLLTLRRFDGWTATFLTTTAATSITGFLFPVHHFMPSHGVGIVSLVVLAAAIPARYARHLEGPWRRIYIVGALTALYLNVFVLIAQSFQKIPALKELAPTQSEPPFLITQLVLLLLYVTFTVLAAKRFRGEPLHTA